MKEFISDQGPMVLRVDNISFEDAQLIKRLDKRVRFFTSEEAAVRTQLLTQHEIHFTYSNVSDPIERAKAIEQHETATYQPIDYDDADCQLYDTDGGYYDIEWPTTFYVVSANDYSSILYGVLPKDQYDIVMQQFIYEYLLSVLPVSIDKPMNNQDLKKVKDFLAQLEDHVMFAPAGGYDTEESRVTITVGSKSLDFYDHAYLIGDLITTMRGLLTEIA